jgi:hypothetical protein
VKEGVAADAHEDEAEHIHPAAPGQHPDGRAGGETAGHGGERDADVGTERAAGPGRSSEDHDGHGRHGGALVDAQDVRAGQAVAGDALRDGAGEPQRGADG